MSLTSTSIAANRVELWLRFDDVYRPCLTIPLETCTRFATYPLAWLSHLGFCLCAREGHVSNSDNGPEIEYRDSPAITPGIYHYIIAEDPLWLEQVMNDRSSFESAHTAHRQDFRQDIIDRDATCVVTNATQHICQACHIIPHSRGDQYISNIAVHREAYVEPPLEDINDTRNGLLLQISLHLPFGESSIAFLRVPNYAMDVTDVNHVTQPNSNPVSYDVEKRLILQRFNNTGEAFFNLIFSHNCDARISDSPDWPPDMLFDITYGSAALKAWGDPRFREFLQGSHNRDRGSRGRGGGGQRGGRKGKGKGRAQEDNHKQSARDVRAAKWAARWGEAEGQAGESRPDSLDLIVAFWKYNARIHQYRDSDEVMNTDRNQDEVQAWLNSIS